MWLFGYVCHWGILLYKIAGSLQPDSFEKHLLFANHSLFHFSFLGHLIRTFLSRHAAAVCRAAGLFNCIDSTGLPHYPLQPVLHSPALVPGLCFPVFGLVVESPPSPFLWNQRVVPLSFSDTSSGNEDLPFFGQEDIVSVHSLELFAGMILLQRTVCCLPVNPFSPGLSLYY